MSISQDKQLSKSNLRETTGSESDGGDSSSTKSEGASGTVAAAAIQPNKVMGVGFGDIFKDKPIKLRPRATEVENDFVQIEKTMGKKLPPTTATPDLSKTEMDSRTKTKDYCKVIFPHEAQNDDELTMKEGDVVTFINKDCIHIGWGDGPKIALSGSTLSSILDKDLSDRSNDTDLEGFDFVVSSTEKLSHPTTSRLKAIGRRPPSESLTSSSLSRPYIFDSPSPEEDKEEHISLAHRRLDIYKKTSKTVTISKCPTTRHPCQPSRGRPASLSSAVSSPLSSSLGTAGHRAKSPFLFGMEGKPKMEPAASSQAAVEELRAQVCELRSVIETMKDQQKREINQLLSELDEEKKIRLRLQMEVNDIKKALQSK
ncbi:SH3 domain-containing kinase-binding protein 1 [Fukomys damarensis]|uniref:SH3 domain-containing kinase-binding protein 1 n=1 Tax=Fukomys damarensis TaxID=885580 RepID=A0A091CX59_FUKDA|nr:SH3 domain-containing kinase-binding protein 1 [Fukomys damarensis]